MGLDLVITGSDLFGKNHKPTKEIFPDMPEDISVEEEDKPDKPSDAIKEIGERQEETMTKDKKVDLITD